MIIHLEGLNRLKVDTVNKLPIKAKTRTRVSSSALILAVLLCVKHLGIILIYSGAIIAHGRSMPTRFRCRSGVKFVSGAYSH